MRTLLLVALVAALATACTAYTEEPAPVIDGSFTGVDGVVSDVSDPSRIVTLAGDFTELIFALGEGNSIVATDMTTVYPAEAVALPKAGLGRFLSAEMVLAHDPTLVIGDTQAAPLAAIEQIRAAGVPVIIFDVSTSFETMYEKIEVFGAILGVEEAANALVERLEREIEEAGAGRTLSDDSPTVAYLYTRGPDVMLLFGSGMVSNPVLEAAGARDAGVLAGIQGSIAVTPEALIAAAPDVIVVPSHGLAVLGGIEGLLAIPGIAETPAGLHGRILAYPEGDFLTIGPRIAVSIAQLANDLSEMDFTP